MAAGYIVLTGGVSLVWTCAHRWVAQVGYEWDQCSWCGMWRRA